MRQADLSQLSHVQPSNIPLKRLFVSPPFQIPYFWFHFLSMVSAYMAIPIDQYLGDTPKNTLVTNHKHRDPTSTFHCIRPPWPWPFGTLPQLEPGSVGSTLITWAVRWLSLRTSSGPISAPWSSWGSPLGARWIWWFPGVPWATLRPHSWPRRCLVLRKWWGFLFDSVSMLRIGDDNEI